MIIYHCLSERKKLFASSMPDCYSSALLNRHCKNPFEIAFADGIFALLNHVLTVCAACAQTWAELLRPIAPMILLFYLFQKRPDVLILRQFSLGRVPKPSGGVLNPVPKDLGNLSALPAFSRKDPAFRTGKGLSDSAGKPPRSAPVHRTATDSPRPPQRGIAGHRPQPYCLRLPRKTGRPIFPGPRRLKDFIVFMNCVAVHL